MHTLEESSDAITFLISTIYLLAYFYIKVLYVVITVQTMLFSDFLKPLNDIFLNKKILLNANIFLNRIQ